MRILDFRSDTVTKPSPEMRAAMAEAEVGDDVLERDPTLDRLERKVAEVLGKEAALWTPTGCMANGIAMMLHLRRGDRFLAPAQAHVLGSELGTAAWLAGGMPEALPWTGKSGRITGDQVRKAAGSSGPYYTLRTTLLCLENTHNFAGGTCLSLQDHRELTAAAQEKKLAVHLDGARLWHAAAFLGVLVHELADGADTVSVCLSKGLGAPMGSLLAGTAEKIEEARRIRKMLGGGVRQGGVMAAAGLVALDYLPRIPEDHAKAMELATGLRKLGFHLETPETNILLVPVPSVPSSTEALRGLGVLATSVGSALRFITHRDIEAGGIQEALGRIATCADAILSASET
ncbi:MAG: aminotransferase class I/II-fold pyridoxal phosphate-dependent enzyme [Holophagaceae bacterium]|nr:aminotransferase class I/II-fold pyridoxal phosphate-dependent enzyme [Holophagaceae bacterium]